MIIRTDMKREKDLESIKKPDEKEVNDIFADILNRYHRVKLFVGNV